VILSARRREWVELAKVTMPITRAEL
jgi:hypothetical protein